MQCDAAIQPTCSCIQHFSFLFFFCLFSLSFCHLPFAVARFLFTLIVLYLGFILRFNRMSKHDHIYFPCDVRKFNWDAYCYNYTLGLLRYIGQETLEDFDQARRRMRKFRIAHYFVLIIYYSLLASIIYGLGYLFGINEIIRVRIGRILHGLSLNAI